MRRRVRGRVGPSIMYRYIDTCTCCNCFHTVTLGWLRVLPCAFCSALLAHTHGIVVVVSKRAHGAHCVLVQRHHVNDIMTLYDIDIHDHDIVLQCHDIVQCDDVMT